MAAQRVFQIDDPVECLFSDGHWYTGKVTARKTAGSIPVYDVLYDDGDRRTDVPSDEVRAHDRVVASPLGLAPSDDDTEARQRQQSGETSEPSQGSYSDEDAEPRRPMGLTVDHSGGGGGNVDDTGDQQPTSFVIGARVMCEFYGSGWFPGSITSVPQAEGGCYGVRFDDGDTRSDAGEEDLHLIPEDEDDDDEYGDDVDHELEAGRAEADTADAGQATTAAEKDHHYQQQQQHQHPLTAEPATAESDPARSRRDENEGDYPTPRMNAEQLRLNPPSRDATPATHQSFQSEGTASPLMGLAQVDRLVDPPVAATNADEPPAKYQAYSDHNSASATQGEYNDEAPRHQPAVPEADSDPGSDADPDLDADGEVADHESEAPGGALLLPQQGHSYWTLVDLERNDLEPHARLRGLLLQLSIAEQIRQMQSLLRDFDDDFRAFPELRAGDTSICLPHELLLKRICDGRARCMALSRVCYGQDSVAMVGALCDLCATYAVEGFWEHVSTHMSTAGHKLVTLTREMHNEESFVFRTAVSALRGALRIGLLCDTLAQHAASRDGYVDVSLVDDLQWAAENAPLPGQSTASSHDSDDDQQHRQNEMHEQNGALHGHNGSGNPERMRDAILRHCGAVSFPTTFLGRLQQFLQQSSTDNVTEDDGDALGEGLLLVQQQTQQQQQQSQGGVGVGQNDGEDSNGNSNSDDSYGDASFEDGGVDEDQHQHLSGGIGAQPSTTLPSNKELPLTTWAAVVDYLRSDPGSISERPPQQHAHHRLQNENESQNLAPQQQQQQQQQQSLQQPPSQSQSQSQPMAEEADCLSAWMRDAETGLNPSSVSHVRMGFGFADPQRRGIAQPGRLLGAMKRYSLCARTVASTSIPDFLRDLAPSSHRQQVEASGRGLSVQNRAGRTILTQIPIMWEEIVAHMVSGLRCGVLDLLRFQVLCLLGTCQTFLGQQQHTEAETVRQQTNRRTARKGAPVIPAEKIIPARGPYRAAAAASLEQQMQNNNRVAREAQAGAGNHRRSQTASAGTNGDSASPTSPRNFATHGAPHKLSPSGSSSSGGSGRNVAPAPPPQQRRDRQEAAFARGRQRAAAQRPASAGATAVSRAQRARAFSTQQRGRSTRPTHPGTRRGKSGQNGGVPGGAKGNRANAAAVLVREAMRKLWSAHECFQEALRGLHSLGMENNLVACDVYNSHAQMLLVRSRVVHREREWDILARCRAWSASKTAHSQISQEMTELRDRRRARGARLLTTAALRTVAETRVMRQRFRILWDECFNAEPSDTYGVAADASNSAGGQQNGAAGARAVAFADRVLPGLSDDDDPNRALERAWDMLERAFRAQSSALGHMTFAMVSTCTSLASLAIAMEKWPLAHEWAARAVGICADLSDSIAQQQGQQSPRGSVHSSDGPSVASFAMHSSARDILGRLPFVFRISDLFDLQPEIGGIAPPGAPGPETEAETTEAEAEPGQNVETGSAKSRTEQEKQQRDEKQRKEETLQAVHAAARLFSSGPCDVPIPPDAVLVPAGVYAMQVALTALTRSRDPEVASAISCLERRVAQAHWTMALHNRQGAVEAASPSRKTNSRPKRGQSSAGASAPSGPGVEAFRNANAAAAVTGAHLLAMQKLPQPALLATGLSTSGFCERETQRFLAHAHAAEILLAKICRRSLAQPSELWQTDVYGTEHARRVAVQTASRLESVAEILHEWDPQALARDCRLAGRIFKLCGDLPAATRAYQRCRELVEIVHGPQHPKSKVIRRIVRALRRLGEGQRRTQGGTHEQPEGHGDCEDNGEGGGEDDGNAHAEAEDEDALSMDGGPASSLDSLEFSDEEDAAENRNGAAAAAANIVDVSSPAMDSAAIAVAAAASAGTAAPMHAQSARANADAAIPAAQHLSLKSMGELVVTTAATAKRARLEEIEKANLASLGERESGFPDWLMGNSMVDDDEDLG